METRKTTFGTRTKLTASMADLGSVVRLNPINNNSFSDRFIFNKALQLVKAPITDPVVHNLSSSLFSNTFEVFHDNLVSIEFGNNIFTDVVIYPSHPTSFSSREFFKQSLARTSAYGLKFTTQILKFPFDLLDFSRIIKPIVRTDSKVVYSEINAENNVLRTVVLLSGSNLFRECEQEKASSFFIHTQEAFGNFPSEIFFVASRNIKFELLPFFKQSKNKDVPFDVSTPRKVISDRSMFDDWFSFCFLDHSASLSHTSNSYLGWKFETLSDSLIDSIMEFEVLSNLMLPGIINTKLESFSIPLNSSNNFFSWINSDFCSSNSSHNNQNVDCIYKCFERKEVIASPPTTEVMGIRSDKIL